MHGGRRSFGLCRARGTERHPAGLGSGRPIKRSVEENSAHQQAVKAGRGERPEPAIFAAEIAPGLRQLPIRAMVAATGLSEHYCSLIRLGKRVPHPRYWEALAALGGGAAN